MMPSPTADYAGKRLLLVDADVRNLLELTPMFEGWSIDVTAAGDAQEAVETLKDDAAFDMIILNLETSSAEHFETVERIRQDSRLVNIPVIALTGALDKEEKERASDRGINDFATRPVTAAALMALLDRYLKDNTAQDLP